MLRRLNDGNSICSYLILPNNTVRDFSRPAMGEEEVRLCVLFCGTMTDRQVLKQPNVNSTAPGITMQETPRCNPGIKQNSKKLAIRQTVSPSFFSGLFPLSFQSPLSHSNPLGFHVPPED